MRRSIDISNRAYNACATWNLCYRQHLNLSGVNMFVCKHRTSNEMRAARQVYSFLQFKSGTTLA